MEVILRQDVEKLGIRGDVVTVAAGYARNCLIPQSLAVPATASNKKIVEQERQAHLRKDAKLAGEAVELGKLISQETVRISQKAGENDHLFGSVTSKDIADVLAVKGYTIDRRKVELADPIKQLGEYKVSIRLHKDVTVQVPVIVTKEE